MKAAVLIRWESAAGIVAVGQDSAQQRALKVQLEGCRRTRRLWKDSLKMLGGLQQRIGLRTAGRGLLLTKQHAHPVQSLALRRLAARVKQGGHNVRREDVLRRFDRDWRNFQCHYRALADAWTMYDNSGDRPRMLEKG